jgi:phage baseplate assembly protein W
MARTIYQYKPYNDTPDIAVGILLPFNKAASAKTDTQNYASGSLSGGSVFALSYTTEEQSISNFKNLLLTGKGERIMQPNFGTRIRESLFEQNTEVLADTLSSSLRDDIEYWLPYIIIDAIDITRDENTLSIRISFRVTESGANLVINVLASENAIIISQTTPNLDVQQQLIAIGQLTRRI